MSGPTLSLGAGQEVGKSCVVVSIGGKRIMFDCGLHMGHNDHRRYPDFSRISKSGDFDSALTCVVITHFHLDHIGALVYFTEVCGYNGPIYMTILQPNVWTLFTLLSMAKLCSSLSEKKPYLQYPTKALAPLMLEDSRKLMEEEQFSNDQIKNCMKKVTAVDLKQTVQVDDELQIRAYYAGHFYYALERWKYLSPILVLELSEVMKLTRIKNNPFAKAGAHPIFKLLRLFPVGIAKNTISEVLGAAMFYAKVGDSAIVYTGDYNMTPDRHLGAAQIDPLELDLLITDISDGSVTFYAVLQNDSFMGYTAVLNNGSFMGFAYKELCMLMDDYWERMNLKVPIYFSAVSEFDRSFINASGPCVLFASPGMISGGFSLEVFKQWAPSRKESYCTSGIMEAYAVMAVIVKYSMIFRYCVAGTVGHQLKSDKSTRVHVDKETQVDVRCQIHHLSFSPHTDEKGIMDLIKFLSPKHVMLVHGELPKMVKLKEKIESDLGIKCCYPANNSTVEIASTQSVKINATDSFVQKCLRPNFELSNTVTVSNSDSSSQQCNAALLRRTEGSRVAEGILVMDKTKRAKAVDRDELLPLLGADEHLIGFAYCCPVSLSSSENAQPRKSPTELSNSTPLEEPQHHSHSGSLIHQLFLRLSSKLESEVNIQEFSDRLELESLRVSICSNSNCPYRIESCSEGKSVIFLCCSWSLADEELGWRVIAILRDSDFSTTAFSVN
ncbi:hypothetical protein Scep_022736 [Stephania cephalantha]|uniref:Metallo-beta-lactamase domain-containing protein n=1 Tax=Stephania cephalantha TaxID=152367 RepID=A0AAP0F8M1_9MAGN